MSLNSPDFLFLFLPLFFLLYSLAKNRLKLMVGVLGSVLFYSRGNFHHLVLMIGLTLFAYLAARALDRWRGERIAGFIFWFGILLVVGILVVFKLRTDAAYPLGLSYVTFQIIAYFIEVQKTPNESEKDILKFSFYLLLFPKIPVGPIV